MQQAIDDVIATALKQVQDMAQSQTNRLLSEMQSQTDAANAAKVQFNIDMEQAQALRKQAAGLEAEAIRRMDTAMTEIAAISQALVLQLAEGRMITGSDMPRQPRRKQAPRLKVVKAA